MATQNPTASTVAEPPDEATLDLRAQLAVLDRVIDSSPVHLTLADLVRSMDAHDFIQRDRVERAVLDLHDAGLLLRCCGAHSPTRAAVLFARLERSR